MKLKAILKKIIWKERADSDSFVKYLRQLGCRIGDNTVVYRPSKVYIDTTRPYLIDIGSNVKITEGVTILTHGYDWSVLNGVYGSVLGSAGKVKIGNNVFIGMKTTILKGVTIGDNVIIGANSLINKNIPDNSVVAGNPARVICDIENYYKKRLKNQMIEARQCAIEWREVYKGTPPKEIFDEFFWLFEVRGEEGFECEKFENKMKLNGNYEKAVIAYNAYNRPFKSFEDFLEWCYREGESIEINGKVMELTI